MSRVRLVAAVVQLELVADDGEMLTPLEVGAVRVPAAEWPLDLDRLIAGVQRQLDETAKAPRGAPLPPVEPPAPDPERDEGALAGAPVDSTLGSG